MGYSADDTGKPKVKASFTVHKPGHYVVDIIANNVYKVRYHVNSVQMAFDRYQSQIFDMGDLKEGDEVEISVEFNDSYSSSGSIRFDFAQLNRDVLKEQYETINSRSLDVKEAKDGYIKGKISVEEAGTLFAAIPYDEGWSAKVDGKKVKIEKVQNAFMGIELTEGEHTVEFYYTAPGFYPGLLIMAISWGIFIFIIGRNSFGAKKKHSICAPAQPK